VLIKLICFRIRNPWGGSVEWKGKWSDKSGTWDYVSEEEKKKIEFEREADGEFWMSYEDFLKNWDHVEVGVLIEFLE
jgi:calpain